MRLEEAIHPGAPRRHPVVREGRSGGAMRSTPRRGRGCRAGPSAPCARPGSTLRGGREAVGGEGAGVGSSRWVAQANVRARRRDPALRSG
jgi:hypothetical protein